LVIALLHQPHHIVVTSGHRDAAQPELNEPHRQCRHVDPARRVGDEPSAILSDARGILDLIQHQPPQDLVDALQLHVFTP
jgi:hypothetical protein